MANLTKVPQGAKSEGQRLQKVHGGQRPMWSDYRQVGEALQWLCDLDTINEKIMEGKSSQAEEQQYQDEYSRAWECARNALEMLRTKYGHTFTAPDEPLRLRRNAQA